MILDNIAIILNVEEFIQYSNCIGPNWVGKLFEVSDLQDIFNSSNTKAREGIINDISTMIYLPGRSSQILVSLLILSLMIGLGEFTN